MGSFLVATLGTFNLIAIDRRNLRTGTILLQVRGLAENPPKPGPHRTLAHPHVKWQVDVSEEMFVHGRDFIPVPGAKVSAHNGERCRSDTAIVVVARDGPMT